MLRIECAPNEGLHQDISEIGSESSEHAPGLVSRSPQLTITPLGDGAGGGDETLESGPPNTTSTSFHGENRSDDPSVASELDPHICKSWPCPQCHKPRDSDDEVPEGQYSAEAALRPTATTQSFFHPHEPQSLKLEQSESDDDLLLDIVATSAHAGQSHKGHCS